MMTSDFEINQESWIIKKIGYLSIPSFRSWLENSLLLGGGILSLGIYEAALLSTKPVPASFALKYSLNNMLSGVVWKKIEPHRIAHAYGLGNQFLIESKIGTQRNYMRFLRVDRVRALRYVFSSYFVLYQLYNWSNIHEIITKRDSIHERVLRLSCCPAHLTKYSISIHGDSIIPISPSILNHNRLYPLEANHSRSMILPSKKSVSDWCIKTKDDQNIFVLEVDYTQGSDSIEDSKEQISNYVDEILYLSDIDIKYYSVGLVKDLPSSQVSTDIVISTSILDVHEIVSSIKNGFESDQQHSHVILHSALDEDRILLTSGLCQNGFTVSKKEEVPSIHLIVSDTMAEALLVCGDLEKENVNPKHIYILLNSNISEEIEHDIHYNVLYKNEIYDKVLQRVRELLREGISPEQINKYIRRNYGPVNSYLSGYYRSDQNSLLKNL